jgi:vacuolar protein sorting-associated protein 13A/C
MAFGLSGTVVKILNQVLGSFVEDINQDQFDLSVFSGKVALRDISVRSSVFDNLPIPFKLTYGKVGKIDVDIPIMSLFSSPLKIKVEDVFILVK